MQPVQYRLVDLVLSDKQTALAKANAAGILVVDLAPPSPASFAETPFRTAGATKFAVETAGPAVACVLMKLYLMLPDPLVGAGPYYPIICDKAAAIAPGDVSIVPTPKMTTAGQLYFLEPPGGIEFSNGIRVALSSTPMIYAAVAEQCSVAGWTVP